MNEVFMYFYEDQLTMLRIDLAQSYLLYIAEVYSIVCRFVWEFLLYIAILCRLVDPSEEKYSVQVGGKRL